MCPLFFTLPLPPCLKKWWPCCNKEKNKLLVNNKSIYVYIKFFAYTFFLSRGCYSLKLWITDLLPSGLMLLRELERPFTQRADKQNLSLVSTTRCSFKRRRPCTYKWRSLFWIHRGRRHPEQRHGDPDTFLNK